MTSRTAPLSYGQELFWLLDHSTPGLLAYNVPRAFRVRGVLDADALERALNALVERHEVLRSVYALQGDHPVQRVLESATVPFERVDLRDKAAASSDATLAKALQERASYHFDLSKDVLLRATLFRLGDSEHVLFLLTHHIVSDGWSKSITYRELSELYAAMAEERAPKLPALPLQFAEYAKRERERLTGAALEEPLAYWRQQLRGPLPVLDLQTDKPRLSSHSFEGEVREAVLPKSLADAMRKLGQAHGASFYMVLLAAYQTLLHRYSGQDDIIVGSPTAGRGDEETQDLIGYFAGALVMRTSFSGDPTFAELLERVSNTALDAYEHQDIPLEKLVLELQKGQELTHAPLFQCVLTMEDTIPATLTLGDTSIEPVDIEVAATKFDLVMLFSESAEGLKLRLGFRTALFDGDRIERMLVHLETLLTAAVKDPARRVSSLPILSERETEQLLGEWSGKAVDDDGAMTVVAMAEASAAAAPQRVAVIGADETLTWGELNTRANRIARWLGDHGTAPDVAVGLCLDRSAELIVGMLGVLKSGAAYVPLVPDLPPARLAEQIRESGAKVVVTTSGLRARLPNGIHTLMLDAQALELSGLSHENPAPRATPDALAYVLFTSGSTGVPKGVAITHANLAHYVRAISRRIGLSLDARAEPWGFATVSTLGADLGHTAVFPALCSGGTLHVVPADVATDASRFSHYMSTQKVDLLKITPSHLRALIACGPTRAILPKRWIVLGGEALPWSLANELVREGTCRVLNHYGPTETTVGVCTFEVTKETRAGNSLTVPIGQPLPSATVYVRDAHGELTPLGVAGELYVGGEAVARGYLGRDDLTTERFSADPYRKKPGARLYRTGDRVRRLASGDIEFLGRVDLQVKVRGFRVELGEIEQALRLHPGVKACAVMLRSDEQPNGQLVAYIVAKQAGYAVSHSDRPTAERLTELLAAQLPDYMVPGAFVFLEQLPLTANGKLDRASLPAPDASRKDEFVPPTTDTEIVLGQIWSDILKRERVGVSDNFIAMGGHSLLAIRVLGKISKQLGVRLPLRTLFDAPTVSQLAKVVDAARIEREEAAMLDALASVEGLSDADAASMLGGRATGGNQ